MKHQKFFVLLAGICVWLTAAGSVRAQNNPITIMPMGDSVTARGDSPESSYRYWLWLDLSNAGFNVQFVGQNSGVSDGAPANSWPDEAYEGGPLSGIPDGDGWTSTDGVLDAPNAVGLGPQIVLLDLGANDFFADIPLGQTETNLETIIQDFTAQNSSVIILLATPTGFVPASGLTRQQEQQQMAEQSHLAGAISKVVSAEKKAHVNITKVNLFGGFNPKRDTKDGTHPNIPGEQLIAKRYFSALRPIIKKMIKNGA